jgi:hypothetical protein
LLQHLGELASGCFADATVAIAEGESRKSHLAYLGAALLRAHRRLREDPANWER